MARKQSKIKINKTTREQMRSEVSETPAETAETEVFPRPRVGKRVWFGGGLIIMAAAIFLRLYNLGLKPFHHDEGVNGLFMMSLFKDGIYKYDPANYHGPTLYYFALVSSYVFGLEDFAVRFVTAFCGILIVGLTFSLRRYLGNIGTLAAAALLALSPGLVYISRYFIHEIPFLLFTFAVVVCLVKFLEGEKPSFFAVAAMFGLLFVCWLPLAQQIPIYVGAGESLQAVLRYSLFVLGIIAAFDITRRLLSWNNGSPIYVLLAAGFAALTFATKETAFVSFGTMLIALGVIWFWSRFAGDIKTRRRLLLLLQIAVLILLISFDGEVKGILNWFQNAYLVNAEGREQPFVLLGIVVLTAAGVVTWAVYFFTADKNDSADSSIDEPPIFNRENLSAKIGGSKNLPLLILLSALTFAVVGIVFFSSFLTYKGGIGAAFEAYNIWTKTGTQTHTQNGFLGYLKWGFAAESPVFVLGAVGALTALWKAKHRFAMFTALWAFGLLAAYTIIPYKTPWLAINFILPMALIGGYGINELAGSRRVWCQYAAAFLLGTALIISLYQTVELNFFRYDDDSRPYIYAHTRRDYTQMIEAIEDISEQADAKENLKITIISPDYFPLPWTLHHYTNTLFFGKMVDTAADSEIIIGSTTQIEELERKYSATHESVGKYNLRPGVELVLYKRRNL